MGAQEKHNATRREKARKVAALAAKLAGVAPPPEPEPIPFEPMPDKAARQHMRSLRTNQSGT